MKTPWFIGLAGLCLLSGCGEESGKPASPAGSPTTNANSRGGSVLTAPVDYLGAAGKAQQSAEKTVDVASVNQAIKLFQVQEGRWPKDLDELVSEKYLGRIPPTPFGTRLVYDPATGEARVVRQ